MLDTVWEKHLSQCNQESQDNQWLFPTLVTTVQNLSMDMKVIDETQLTTQGSIVLLCVFKGDQ